MITADISTATENAAAAPITATAENTAPAGGDGVAAVEATAGQAGHEPMSETKAFSERLNKKTEALQRRISEYEKRETELAQRLKNAGLPAEPSSAADAVIAAGSELFSGPEGERDLKMLGEEDARRVLAEGGAEKQLEKLLAKPVALRTLRDRACYERLKSGLAEREGQKQLAALGVDTEKLSQNPEYREFCQVLDSALSEPQKYALYRRYAAPDAAARIVSPPAVSSGGPEGARDYFTPEQVDRMSRSEVDRNLSKILASMTKWGKKTR